MKLRTALGVILAACLSNPVQAVVVGMKDWRQVTDTTNNSWNDIDAIFDNTTGQCDVVGCMLGGADLTGYTWASNADVDALFMFYNGGTGLSSLNSNNIAFSGADTLDSFFVDFTPTASGANFDSIVGHTRDSQAPTFGDGITGSRLGGSTDASSDFHSLKVDTLRTHTDDSLGGWFYQPIPLPIPDTAFLVGLGLALIGIIRRKQRQAVA